MKAKVDLKAIKELAYRLWEKRGKPIGNAETDWFEAERQLQTRHAESKALDEVAKESFPASDPPASGLPDKPPANAEAKWAAAGRSKRATPEEPPKLGSRDAPGG